MEEIGNQLKKARLTAHLTQEDVAQRLFVTRQTVSRWEQDKNLPNIYVLKDLSQLYQVDISYFFGQEQAAEKLEIKKKMNVWALMGVISFNLFFFSSVYLFIILLLLFAWSCIITFIVLPVAYLQMSNGEPLPLHLIGGLSLKLDLWLSLFLCAIGFAVSPAASFISRQVWCLTKRYVRYNLKSIYY